MCRKEPARDHCAVGRLCGTDRTQGVPLYCGRHARGQRVRRYRHHRGVARWPTCQHDVACAGHGGPCQGRAAATFAPRRLATHGPHAPNKTPLRRSAWLPNCRGGLPLAKRLGCSQGASPRRALFSRKFYLCAVGLVLQDPITGATREFALPDPPKFAQLLRRHGARR